jgi:hypothetical protein
MRRNIRTQAREAREAREATGKTSAPLARATGNTSISKCKSNSNNKCKSKNKCLVITILNNPTPEGGVAHWAKENQKQ